MQTSLNKAWRIVLYLLYTAFLFLCFKLILPLPMSQLVARSGGGGVSDQAACLNGKWQGGGGPQKKVKLVSRTGDLRMNERSMPKQSCFSFLQVERLHSVKLSPDVSPQPQATVRMFWGEKQITAKRFLSLNILRTVPTSDCVH